MRIASIIVLAVSLMSAVQSATAASADEIKEPLDRAIRSLMAKYLIPGMAVGITAGGKSRVYNYGVASKQAKAPVDRNTLFELGSVTKTFTATMTSWAEVNGRLSLSDPVEKYLTTLRGTPFGKVSLLNLGTHTPGGLPLQVPDDVKNEEQLLKYFHEWAPAYVPGTVRTYANPGIATLGWIAAKSLGQDFTTLIERRLFPALGMRHSFIEVPASQMPHYAQGYKKDGTPIRMTAGVLSAEAYGIRSTAADMLRFLEANMSLLHLDPKLQRAIINTHTGYFKVGKMTQDLIWEQYRYPVELKDLLAGNSSEVIFNPTPVIALVPPEAPLQAAWLNKTGSTNGFAAYVAFVPAKKIGLVLLANKSYPIPDRVAVANQIMSLLARSKRK